MRFALFFCLLGMLHAQNTPSSPLRVIVFGAHPDDCDITFGGTAVLFSKLGHKVKFVSVTKGDAGHQSEGGGALARRRRAEAEESGRRLGVEYEVMDFHDGELQPTVEARNQVIRRIREWKADVVVGPRMNDYHPDHRYTGMLLQDAAYMVVVPNVTPDTPPLRRNPVFLYNEDRFQRPNPFRPDIAVVIDSVFDQKISGMDAHVSQFYEWLPWVDGTLDQVPKDKAERKQWLAQHRQRPIRPAVKEAIAKWYGEAVAAKAQHAESFEVCEYGRQPKDEDIKQLFPMLGQAALK